MANASRSTEALVLDYIERGRVDVVNVASHFGVTQEAARAVLRTLEKRGAIRKVFGAAPMWEADPRNARRASVAAALVQANAKTGLLGSEVLAEIVGPSGKVHYRRPPSHPDVAEARRTPGYSVRLVEVRHGPYV
jgi:hypothetical protein